MQVRNAELHDVDQILVLINEAKDYFKKNGIDQWQDGYPNKDTIINDVKDRSGYVLEDQDAVIGYVYASIGEDPTYNYIENGEWLTKDTTYMVLHRVVVDSKLKGKGLAGELTNYFVNECKDNQIQSIRIDTHDDNISMQKFLSKHDFKKCGRIYLESGAKRIGFERIIK